MARILLIDLSSAYLPPPIEYRDLLRRRIAAEDMIKGQWNAHLKNRGPLTYSRGLLSIAACLERAGHQVTYKHCGFSGEDCVSLDVIHNVDIVGLTCVTATFPVAIALLRRIKYLNPDALTVLGGNHATYLAEEIIEEYAPLADVVVRREGEITMTEIADHPHHLESIAGITYYELNRQGNATARQNPERAPCDLDDLPQPAYHLLSSSPSHYSHSIMTSRGCAFHCDYCVDGRYFVKFRHHPIEKIVDELVYLAGRVPEGALVHFSDSILNIDKGYLRDLVARLKSANTGLRFSCDLRADTIDQESIELMSSAGFIQYDIGIETSDDSILVQHKRSYSFQESINVCQFIRSVDDQAFIRAYWIIGLPGTSLPHTRDEAKTIHSLIRQNIVNTIGNKVFVPYPGTPVFDHPEQFGLHIHHRDWSKYVRTYKPVYSLDALTPDSLFECLLAHEQALVDAFCETLGIDVAELDSVVTSDYFHRQNFAALPAQYEPT